jgi:HAD superfamily hydrolase (TIGR01544 family)
MTRAVALTAVAEVCIHQNPSTDHSAPPQIMKRLRPGQTGLCSMFSLIRVCFVLCQAETPLRDGYQELCNVMNEHKLPLTVVSAGITQIIEAILAKNEFACSNCHVIANEMRFDPDGKICGWSDLIHSENKQRASQNFRTVYEERVGGRGVILLGDNLGDLGMTEGGQAASLITIGFLNEIDERTGRTEANFVENFDIVLVGDASLDYVVDLIADLCKSL